MRKILLYYVFTPLNDPEAIRLWQKALCERLELRGRIIISKHGLNGTVGGEIDALRTYVKETKAYAPFKGIDFKWSDGLENDFPKLSIKVRDEIVTFGAPDELKVDEHGIVGGGIHLEPEQVHKLVAERGKDVVFFDGRNAHEATIGKFKDAVVPAIDTTRDFIAELESGKYDDIKKKPVVTYCTGGIRCEVLSTLMKNRGFEEVYQMDGGIVRYGETYGDKGLWEGSLYVFDGRGRTEFSEHAKQIGACLHCNAPANTYYNCTNKACNKLIVLCDACAAAEAPVCSSECREKAAAAEPA
ncbi:MAG TPA: rhodanese-related sulfurtransferase [Candidatus Saccharimonadales bacterium]|nr:rhodanese-related sulfurtransferase [Candidatus Saccharimonadales bacterium]